jgi:hypothetical protein
MKRAAGLILLFVLAGCTSDSAVSETPTLVGQGPPLTTVRPSVGTSPSPVDFPPTESPTGTGHSPGEPVLSLPGIGALYWDCRGAREGGSLIYKFSTTFTADAATATETVSYSLDGGASVSKVLQPGKTLSTPFKSATSHLWHVVQSIEPYTTRATIEVTLGHNSFGQCLNPDIQVSRVRDDHIP